MDQGGAQGSLRGEADLAIVPEASWVKLRDVRGGERLGHFSGPFRATPFPLARGSQNGPRCQGFASPRNTGAPLTAAGRSERTPPSKRERGRAKSNQTTAVLAPFSIAIDSGIRFSV